MLHHQHACDSPTAADAAVMASVSCPICSVTSFSCSSTRHSDMQRVTAACPALQPVCNGEAAAACASAGRSRALYKQGIRDVMHAQSRPSRAAAAAAAQLQMLLLQEQQSLRWRPQSPPGVTHTWLLSSCRCRLASVACLSSAITAASCSDGRTRSSCVQQPHPLTMLYTINNRLVQTCLAV